MRTSHPSHRTVRARLAVGVILAAALLSACNDDSGDDQATTPPMQPPVPTMTPTDRDYPDRDDRTPDADDRTPDDEAPAVDEVSPAAADQLCDMMRADIGTWQEQGTTVARVTFNGTVHNWAAQNEGINVVIIRDRSIVDTVTIQNCPDVRDQALDALDLSDLASGLVGFN
ncbi:hypothetical protein GV794_28280 [Nocardia cyriacigeorgica]|uniref:Lipoprotein n=1 Tax=Nocardia cyriacigeorgica TaxID=135487 RepID=A0A6P1D4H9_9NOCA|nr:hypothetical protein [Nocardia cyriacigeorgica]NEW39769.1 hypothetical protein [Nocardia cyriacigeorgica]NEW45496.1 hypothetical protein [Nocardia cyriacigeorgica]NEW52403.1 hypothetical protein [Nocardia cyriacigeorgica]NEW59498.1 hypothetical protein [Nocardia cyriacigeorgica]